MNLFFENSLIFLPLLAVLGMVRACFLLKYKANSAQPILAALEKHKTFPILLIAISVITGLVSFFAIALGVAAISASQFI